MGAGWGRGGPGGVKPGARKSCVGVRKCCFRSEDERNGLVNHMDQTKSGFFSGGSPTVSQHEGLGASAGREGPGHDGVGGARGGDDGGVAPVEVLPVEPPEEEPHGVTGTAGRPGGGARARGNGSLPRPSCVWKSAVPFSVGTAAEQAAVPHIRRRGLRIPEHPSPGCPFLPPCGTPQGKAKEAGGRCWWGTLTAR